MTTDEDDARLGALLADALSSPESGTFDVDVVRWLDGHRIPTRHERLSALDVVALRRLEECHPGDLVVFEATSSPRE